MVIMAVLVAVMGRVRNSNRRVAAVAPDEAEKEPEVHHRSGTYTHIITHTLGLAIQCFNHRTEQFSRVLKRQPLLC